MLKKRYNAGKCRSEMVTVAVTVVRVPLETKQMTNGARTRSHSIPPRILSHSINYFPMFCPNVSVIIISIKFITELLSPYQIKLL